MKQEFFLAGAAALNIDRGIHSAVNQMAVEMQFHVACSLELFKNHFVHAASGINQSGRNDREASVAVNIAGGAEEAFRLVERIRIHTAGRGFCRCGAGGCCRHVPDA